jgi:hypothetical protein
MKQYPMMVSLAFLWYIPSRNKSPNKTSEGFKLEGIQGDL